MNNALTTILVLIVGSVIVFNGVTVDSEKITGAAEKVANQANLHQLVTAVEMYYMANNEYPQAIGGEELVNLLREERYIINRPLDPSVFAYEPLRGGQDFYLDLVDSE